MMETLNKTLPVVQFTAEERDLVADTIKWHMLFADPQQIKPQQIKVYESALAKLRAAGASA